MLDDIDTDDNNKNVLGNMFNQHGKDGLLNQLYANLLGLNLGDAYETLCDKLGALFNDKANGEKYFDNLVNILEILDWSQKKFGDFGCEYFQLLWGKFKSEDKISEFINLVKNFEAKDSEYMFVVKDANGNEFKTPALQITTAQILYDNEKTVIASDINNTCKTGSEIENQFKELSIAPDDWAVPNELSNEDRNNLKIDGKLSRDVFNERSNATEFLLALKKIKDHNEWENKIKKTYGWTLDELSDLIQQIEKYNHCNFARLLSKPENDKILFYNIPIRGKGNGDFQNIDSEEFELFSMFDKNFMFKLDRYHLGKDDEYVGRISHFNKYGANFLFDQVSYNFFNEEQEGYEAKGSKLTGLGKKITKTGLEWFLDENKYTVNETYGISVKEKQIEEDINIINTGEEKISDQAVFNQISKIEEEIDKEIGEYTENFVNHVVAFLFHYLHEDEVMNDFKFKTSDDDLNNNKIRIDQKIGNKVNEFIEAFCDTYAKELPSFQNEGVELFDQHNFMYLVKKVVANLIVGYLQSLKDDQKQDLINGETSIVTVIGELVDEAKENEDQSRLFNRKEIKSRLVEALYYNKEGWWNPQKYDKKKNAFVKDDFRFDFDKANLKAKETATLLNENFSKFKKEVLKVFPKGLPDEKNDFEKDLDRVNCADFVSFLKRMGIGVDEEFLKRALIALFYTWVESAYGNDDNGDHKIVNERLQEMREYFPDDDRCPGTQFIHKVKLYSSKIIDEGEKPLPDAFYNYNSIYMKIGNEDSTAYRFTVINYFQSFFHAIPALERKKFENLYWWSRWWSHRKFNKNIEKVRRILQTGTDIERMQIFNRMRQIRDQKYQGDPWGLPLAFLDILLDGVRINLSLQEKIGICTFARNYVDHELDNPTKEHVTKSNFIEIDKKDNCYLKPEGQVVVPLANLFAPGATDKFIDEIMNGDKEWQQSFWLQIHDAFSCAWHYSDQINIFMNLFVKVLFILCFVLFLPIIGIVLLIAYIVYTKCMKDVRRKFTEDNKTVNKLKKVENQGRGEYNRLRNFRQNMKKQKPPQIIKGNPRKIDLNTDKLNSEFKIINALKDNKIKGNEIVESGTSINQINQIGP